MATRKSIVNHKVYRNKKDTVELSLPFEVTYSVLTLTAVQLYKYQIPLIPILTAYVGSIPYPSKATELGYSRSTLFFYVKKFSLL